MASLKRTLGIVSVAAILLGAPLFAQDVNVDYDHSYRFNQIKSYSWGKVQVSDPTLEPIVVAAIDHVIQGYGFKESDKDKKGDIIITAVEANNPQQYEAFYRTVSDLDWHRGWSNGGFSDSASRLRQIHGGTLIVDIYDGATKKLVWRGTAAGIKVSGGDNSRAQREKEDVGFSPATPQERASEDNVDKAVGIMFANYPPKSGGPIPPNQTQAAPSGSADPFTGPN